MPNLTQRSFRRDAGDRAVLWIRPALIDHHFGTKWPVGKARIAQLNRWLPKPIVNAMRPGLKKREPFIIPAAHFAKRTPITQEARYKLLKDFISKGDAIHDTQWHAKLTEELHTQGVARHKDIAMRSTAEIEAFLREYVGGLVTSLRTTGFSRDVSSFESMVVVNADGTLSKTGSGNHRFAIAHILQLERYPVVLAGAHEDWWRAQNLGAPQTDRILSCLPALQDRYS